jgi:hypothetical protein
MTYSRLAVGWCLVSIALLAGCDGDSTPSTHPSRTPNPFPAPPLTNFVVNGATQIVPGETAEFKALATFNDGSTRDVSGEAQWSSTDSSVLSIVEPGRIVGRAIGEAEVRVTYRSWFSSRVVTSVPKGLVVVRGSVYDAMPASSATAIFGARVEVTRGAAAGTATTTDFDGRFALYGVSDGAEIRVSKDGFEPITQPVKTGTVIRLSQSRERPDVRGTYRLTIGGGTCESGTGFPEALRTRVYGAVLYQDSPSLLMDLKDAEFVAVGGPQITAPSSGLGDRFVGQLLLNEASFTLGDFTPPWDWGGAPTYPSVVERLSDGVLFLTGRIVAELTPMGMSGTYDGAIKVYDRLPGDYDAPRAVCRSRTHKFVLER